MAEGPELPARDPSTKSLASRGVWPLGFPLHRSTSNGILPPCPILNPCRWSHRQGLRVGCSRPRVSGPDFCSLQICPRWAWSRPLTASSLHVV